MTLVIPFRVGGSARLRLVGYSDTAITVTRCVCVPSTVHSCDTADSEADRRRVLKVSQFYITSVDAVRCSTGLLEAVIRARLVD